MHRDADAPPPTRNMPAEESLMACLLVDPNAWESIGHMLSDSRLWSSQHVAILRAMKALDRTGNPADDVVALVTELHKSDPHQDWQTVIMRLMSLEYHGDYASYYLGLVNDAASRRDTLAAATELHRKVYDHGADLPEVLANHRSRIEAIEESRSPFDPADMLAVMSEVAAHLDSHDPPGVPMGFHELDNRLNGGLRAGALVILAARPAVGKSALAGNVAMNIAGCGIPVLLCSLEMKRSEIGQRMLAATSGIPAAKIVRRDLSPTERDRLIDSQNELAALPIRIDHERGRTVPQIAAIARVHKRRHGLGLLIVDYLQLITPEDSRVHREQQVAAMSRQLKCLAGDLDIPVVALCQLNRAIENRDAKGLPPKPRLSDLRDSGCIEQDADIVMFLDRPSLHSDNALPTEAKLTIAKNRNGSTGEVELMWTPETMRFSSALNAESF